MRIGVLAIQHESNTFVPAPTTLAEFRRDALLTGAAMSDYCRRSQHETAGFYAELDAARVEVVPLLLALATPGGALTGETADELVATALEKLRDAGSLDGLLVAPHGAAVSQSERDFDGYWLSRVREAVGPGMPIVGTLDPHANLSPRMVAATDALVAYRTNPHVDQKRTGRLAANLLLRTVRGEARPTQAAAFPPVAISIDRQATSEAPCLDLYAAADEMLQMPGTLSNSIVLGFPYADVEELGSSLIVVTDGDRARAQALADELAAQLVEHRRGFACHLPSVEEALAEAQAHSGRVCLLDVGDNVGGGSAGDGVMLLRQLYELGVARSLVCLWDPAAVAQVAGWSIGQRGSLALGGQHETEQGPPLACEATLVWRGSGRFAETAAVHGGRAEYDMGQAAVVRTDRGPTVLLASQRVPPFSLRQLTACEIDPQACHILVAKGVNAPIAAYREVCDRFIRVNTPGTTTADMTRLAYRHRRRPLFPFESLD